MRVLPVTCTCYQAKTSNLKPASNVRYQNPVTTLPHNPSFKRGEAIAATIFGTIYAGTALLFATPAAVIAGATLLGILSGAALAKNS